MVFMNKRGQTVIEFLLILIILLLFIQTSSAPNAIDSKNYLDDIVNSSMGENTLNIIYNDIVEVSNLGSESSKKTIVFLREGQQINCDNGVTPNTLKLIVTLKASEDPAVSNCSLVGSNYVCTKSMDLPTGITCSSAGFTGFPLVLIQEKQAFIILIKNISGVVTVSSV